MPQFDFYPFGHGFLVDVQTDLVDGLNTRLAVPLLPAEGTIKPARRLNPLLVVGDRMYVLATQFMASVALKELGEKAGSLAHERDAIKAAIDMLLDGF